jgi:hypothetical protein
VTARAAEFRALALALPESAVADHMGVPSFRVAGKIFAQLSADGATGLVKLALPEQAARVAAEPQRYWVPQHWSQFGWTHVLLADLAAPDMRDLLTASWRLVAPKKLARDFAAASK